MKKYSNILLLLYFVSHLSCVKNSNKDSSQAIVPQVNSGEFVDWYAKPKLDSLAGVDIERANLLADSIPYSNEIVVAIIDGVVDIGHQDLRNSIYLNKKEIEGNGIDDDSNGYIDDINGWNFLGKKNGSNIEYASFDYLRILKHLIEKYDAHDLDSLKIIDIDDRKLFKKLLGQRKGVVDYGQTLIDWGENHRNNYFDAYDKYNYLFIKGEFSLKDLDSINPQNKKEAEILKTLQYFKKYDITISRINQIIKDGYARKYLVDNLNFNPFTETDSFPKNFDYSNYGTPNIGDNPERYPHGTQVAGIIGSKRNNNIGIQGVSNNIRLMILEVTPTFHERPKDFVNAVKYAVDNGAKIINYSGSKYMLTNMDEFNGVIEYVNRNNVLFVTSAGNRGINIDLPENTKYPNGISSDGTRMENFIMVGASSRYANENLVPQLSNYGKNSVDIFAPGVEIKTTDVYDNQYITTGGTSLSAAVTSGVAALIWSHYPNLSASEIKKIILKSGTKYDVSVNTKDGMKSFSELSRTGAIINAYDALVLAKEISNQKE